MRALAADVRPHVPGLGRRSARRSAPVARRPAVPRRRETCRGPRALVQSASALARRSAAASRCRSRPACRRAPATATRQEAGPGSASCAGRPPGGRPKQPARSTRAQCRVDRTPRSSSPRSALAAGRATAGRRNGTCRRGTQRSSPSGHRHALRLGRGEHRTRGSPRWPSASNRPARLRPDRHRPAGTWARNRARCPCRRAWSPTCRRPGAGTARRSLPADRRYRSSRRYACSAGTRSACKAVERTAGRRSPCRTIPTAGKAATCRFAELLG